MRIQESMTRPTPAQLRSLILWMVLLLACVLFQWLDLSNLLRFDRQLINDGQWWRLISGNLVHLGWSHLWLNMAGLALVAVFFSPYYRLREWLLLLLLTSLFVGLGLYFFNPKLLWYVGLSGVLHGLFIAGGWQEYRRYGKSGGLLLALIVGKLIWEQLVGPMPGSEAASGGRVMVDAHLYGAIAGVVFIVLRFIYYREKTAIASF